MPFKTEPEKIYINSNKSSLKKKYCVASEITNLLNKRCINEVSTNIKILMDLDLKYSTTSLKSIQKIKLAVEKHQNGEQRIRNIVCFSLKKKPWGAKILLIFLVTNQTNLD
jgi:hypothetical protein